MKRTFSNGRLGYHKNLVKCPYCGKTFQPDGRGPPAIRCRNCHNKKVVPPIEAYYDEASRIIKALYPIKEVLEESKKVN